MLKKLFSVALSGAMLIQNTALTYAKGNEVSEGEEVEVFVEEEPITYGTNDLIIDDEGSDAYGIDVEYHSIGKIREYFAAHPVENLESSFSSTPVTSAPYAPGTLTDATLNDARNAVNLVRYVAGLNYDVSVNPAYTSMVQAGALINAVNNSLSKEPVKPAGMADDLYQLGYQGNSQANLAKGYTSLAKAVTDAWLNDGDEANISKLSHRRWLLNAQMAETGFGQVGSYSGMFAYDTHYASTRTSNVWPAQNTPLELFSPEYPWSISTGNTESASTVNVKMLNTKTNVTYNFSKNNSSGYFAVDNDPSCGAPGTVIWRPAGITYEDGDTYEITISNLSIGTVYYHVTFFQLDTSNERVVMTPSSLLMSVGDTASVSYKIDPSTSTDTFVYRSYFDNGTIRLDHVYQSRFVITAEKPGMTYLRVRTASGNEGYCYITVKGIKVTADSAEMNVGETMQLNASIYPENSSQQYTWASSDTSIATVDANGVVTAKKTGTVNITASAEGYTGTYTITVKDSTYATFLGTQLELAGYIIVDFFVEVPEEYAGAEVVMTTEDGTTRVPVEDGEASSYGNAKLYKYYALSTQMRDTITLYVEKDGNKVPMKTSSGTDYTNGYNYTILKSLNNYKNSSNTKLVELANAMDAFGQYVQILVKHNEEGLTPPQLAAVPMDDLDTYASTRDADLGTLKYAGARLELNSDTTIWLYYQPTAGHTLNEYTFTVDNKPAAVEQSGGYFIIKIDNIKANELGHMYSVKVTDGTNTQTLNYSALSYAQSVITKNSDVNNVNACKAIYWYYKAAVAYAGN